MEKVVDKPISQKGKKQTPNQRAFVVPSGSMKSSPYIDDNVQARLAHIRF